MEKEIKKHGMSSEKASRVKSRGHKKEFIYANLIRGEIVRGTKKEDVRDVVATLKRLIQKALNSSIFLLIVCQNYIYFQ